jgi:hypothetical protein
VHCLSHGVFTSIEDGTKIVHVHLLSPNTTLQFVFSVPVPGIAVDYERRPLAELDPPESLIDCNEPTLRERLRNEPRATTNRRATHEGDPANLVVIGDFATLLAVFGARWDETETISQATSNAWVTSTGSASPSNTHHGAT